MTKKPNIIIFNPDQMRADAVGHLGNPVSCTDFLDSMVLNDAVSFSNAYCQNTVCVPSRCSFFTGLYPHTMGHRTMGHLLREHETSMLKELKEAGYYVWANARNDLVAGQVEGLIESHVSEMFYGGNITPPPEAANPKAKPGEKDFYSFYTGKMNLDADGKYYDGDDEDVDAAVDCILHPRDKNKPLCLFLGLMYPHPPYKIEEPYYSAIDKKRLLPRIKSEETYHKGKIISEIRKYQNMEQYSEEDWDELRAVYLAMCMKVDKQFEKVCNALKEAGEYDNSLIIFMSDHGDYTGDYGLTEKAQNSFEDCLTRVPLVIKPPKSFGCDKGITDSMTELVDFYATVMDFAGVKPSHSHFGNSLSPVLKDRSKENREIVYCEGGRLPNEKHCSEAVDPTLEGRVRMNIYWPRYAAQYDDEAHLKKTMARSRDYKYIHSALGKSEFYSLKEDPKELCNVIDDPKYQQVIQDMKASMLDWYQNTCDIVPIDTDERFSKKMIWEKVKMLCPKEYEEEVKQKIEEGMGLFLCQYYCKNLSSNQAVK